MSGKRYSFSEAGLRRAIADGWANQTPETNWMDDAGQPIPEVVAAAILASRGPIGSRSVEWWTPERRAEASDAARRRHNEPVAQP